ncbi:MAG TPA: FkbM family methyltransferase [Vicinamibacterales bacterium]|nr:FkbM family methyltransferase [Vicinamibacterales bacterium]
MTNPSPKLNASRILTAVLLVVGGAAIFVSGFYAAERTSRVSDPAGPIKREVLIDEAKAFVDKMGSPRYSSHEEELFVRDFFADKRNGVFVDIGASHYRDRSNTYYLETELGWSGLAVDPLPEFAEDYRKHRPRTKYITMFVSDKSDERATLHVGKHSLFSSAERGHTNAFTDVDKTVTAPTITLNDLLATARIEKIDFLSIDVELHEPQVLAGFNIDKVKPQLVCVESLPPVRQQVLDYFAAHRYVVVADYLRADPLNLWFKPLP